jgi:hypothetical protein
LFISAEIKVGWRLRRRQHSTHTTFELGLLLLLLLLGVFSFVCFLVDPVTTSYIVGKLFIMLKSLLLHSDYKYLEFARWTRPTKDKTKGTKEAVTTDKKL